MAVPYKRALVLSGGGAKGVFEAGVLKACHHTGVTFDVLTGSSIGAINAVLFAEYLRRRQRDPDSADGFFDYFWGIWEDLDAANEEMLTGTLTFHRRKVFDRDRNRQLMAMGCWTMLEVLADSPNLARLEESSKQAVRALRDVDTGALHGWRCTHTACRVRDVCTRI